MRAYVYLQGGVIPIDLLYTLLFDVPMPYLGLALTSSSHTHTHKFSAEMRDRDGHKCI